METQVTHSELRATLVELTTVLSLEAELLKRLDHENLDDVTAKKLALHDKIAELAQREKPSAEDLVALENVRHAALRNSLLLVQARDTLRGLLALAANDPSLASGAKRPSGADGVRLSIRG